MAAWRHGIIAADKARSISNGSLIADCPFHETDQQMLRLYPAPLVTRSFFFCLVGEARTI